MLVTGVKENFEEFRDKFNKKFEFGGLVRDPGSFKFMAYESSKMKTFLHALTLMTSEVPANVIRYLVFDAVKPILLLL